MTKQLKSDLAELRKTIKSHQYQARDYQNHIRLQESYSEAAKRLQRIHDLCKQGKFREAFVHTEGMMEIQFPKGLWRRMEKA